MQGRASLPPRRTPPGEPPARAISIDTRRQKSSQPCFVATPSQRKKKTGGDKGASTENDLVLHRAARPEPRPSGECSVQPVSATGSLCRTLNYSHHRRETKDKRGSLNRRHNRGGPLRDCRRQRLRPGWARRDGSANSLTDELSLPPATGANGCKITPGFRATSCPSFSWIVVFRQLTFQAIGSGNWFLTGRGLAFNIGGFFRAVSSGG